MVRTKSSAAVSQLSKTLVMILLIMLPFLGFYAGTIYEKKTQLTNKPQPTLPQKPLEEKIHEGWLLYEENILGISFEYPYFLKVEKIKDSNGITIIEIYNPDSLSLTNHFDSQDRDNYMITMRREQQFASIYNVMSEYASEYNNSVINLNGHIAYKRANANEIYISTIKSADKPQDQKNEKLFLIKLGANTVGLDSIYNDILSTIDIK